MGDQHYGIRADRCTTSHARMWRRGDGGKTGETTGLGRRRPGLRCDQPLPDGVADQARDVVDVELLHHARAVKLGRLEGDPEQRADLLRGLALCHELPDLALPGGQATAARPSDASATTSTPCRSSRARTPCLSMG